MNWIYWTIQGVVIVAFGAVLWASYRTRRALWDEYMKRHKQPPN